MLDISLTSFLSWLACFLVRMKCIKEDWLLFVCLFELSIAF